MPLQPVRSMLCSFLYLSTRRHPQCLLHSAPVRYASQSRLGPKMRTKPINEKTIPNDMGLLDGTFVMPREPSIFSSPARRMRLYGHRLVKNYEAIRMMIAYKWGIGKKPRPKLAWRELRRTAQEFHKMMYTALAEGDQNTLKGICCEGLLTDLQERMSRRDYDYRWTLHKVSFPRVVSSRASMLSMSDKSGIRQHVVKIRSVQSLDHLVTKGKTSSEDQYAAGQKKRMVEYLVLQKRILRGKEGPWLIWGTVQETEADHVLKDKERKGRTPMIEVVKAT